MKKTSSVRIYALVALLAVFGGLAMAQQETDENFLLRVLPGNWKEDQYARLNLNDFLYEMGLSWVKRVYVTSSSWENEQRISIYDGQVTIDGIKGPKRTEEHYTIFLNNVTRSDVDLGELGGLNDATAEVKGNSLVSYLRPKGTEDVALTSTRTVSRDDENKMVFVTKHVPSGVTMTAFFNRQP